MEWKEYKLGELYDVHNGLSKGGQFFGSGYPFLTFSNVFNNYFIPAELTALVQTTEKERKVFDIKSGDIFITRTSETANELGMSCVSLKDYPDATFNGFTKRLRKKIDINVEIDPLFVGYFLRSPKFRALFYGLSGGMSTRASLSNNDLLNLTIVLPEISTQRRISSILSSLDRKIELNNQINKQLEEMAQAIFKSWFIDFEPFKDGEFVDSELGRIPKGWKVVTLDEITSKFGTGLNPRKNFVLGEGENYYVTIKNMGNNRVYLDEKCDKINDEALKLINKRSKLMKGDILYSGVATIGRVALVTEDPTNWHTGETIFNMHPKSVSSEFLFLLLLSCRFKSYVAVNVYGSSQQCISMASLKAFKFAMPDAVLLKAFDSVVIPIIATINSNHRQNDNLSSLRDTLLPKLMSGEINLEQYGNQ